LSKRRHVAIGRWGGPGDELGVIADQAARRLIQSLAPLIGASLAPVTSPFSYRPLEDHDAPM